MLRSGVLSAFIGAPGPGFYGGPEVQALEQEAAERFGVKHVVSVNSWTSGLVAAMGAIGLEPGDEVIVTPWTMVATATAILHWNGIPVFADIDPHTFNLDPAAVEAAITPAPEPFSARTSLARAQISLNCEPLPIAAACACSPIPPRPRSPARRPLSWHGG